MRLNCALFGVQDADNVALFSRDGLWVTIVRDHDLVHEAISAYDDLISSPEAIAPASLRLPG